MGRKRASQKNTLAQWAGAKSSDQAATSIQPSLLLKFKIDKHKLLAHQTHSDSSTCAARAGQADCHLDKSASFTSSTSADGACREVSNGSSNECNTTEPDVLKREPHPFFNLSKRKQTGIPDGNEPQAGSLNTNVPTAPVNGVRAGPASQNTHSFFRPRIAPTASEPQSGNVTRSKRPLEDALLPVKDTMHVLPLTTEDAHDHDFPLPMLRRVESTKDASTLTEDWRDAAWTTMSCGIMHRAKSPSITSRHSSKVKVETQNSTRHHCKSRDHGAIRAMTERRMEGALLTDEEKGKLWTTRYAPRSAAEVLQNGSEAFVLRDWLKSRRLHNRARLDFMNLSRRTEASSDKYADERDDFIIDDDFEALLTSDLGAEFESENEFPCPPGREVMFKSNLVVVSGPTGCGKSAAIQAVANELSFEIFEVNSTDRRSSKDVVEKVGEAAQSQMVNKQRAPDGQQSRSLILFEEVDVLYRDDKDFWSAVLTLVTTSKRPILLTCNDLSTLPRQLQIPSIFLEFSPPSTVLATDYLQALSTIESIDTSLAREVIVEQVHMCNHDLRATINALQFLNPTDLLNDHRSVDSIAEELMAKQVSVSTLYRNFGLGSTSSVSKSSFKQYEEFLSNLSVVDMFATQQRSCALESLEVFENETDDGPARLPEKDDLLGRPVISEPLGRYTRLHPGDSDFALALAFQLQDVTTSSLKAKFPIWTIPQTGRALTTDQTDAHETWHWRAMVNACEPFAVPENWMYDYAPHNSIDRPRLSGILASDVTPYLREMASMDEARTSWERSVMDSHSGRVTRNTMSSEYGLKRQAKIPQSLRASITATLLRYP